MGIVLSFTCPEKHNLGLFPFLIPIMRGATHLDAKKFIKIGRNRQYRRRKQLPSAHFVSAPTFGPRGS